MAGSIKDSQNSLSLPILSLSSNMSSVSSPPRFHHMLEGFPWSPPPTVNTVLLALLHASPSVHQAVIPSSLPSAFLSETQTPGAPQARAWVAGGRVHRLFPFGVILRAATGTHFQGHIYWVWADAHIPEPLCREGAVSWPQKAAPCPVPASCLLFWFSCHDRSRGLLYQKHTACGMACDLCPGCVRRESD